MSFVPATSEDTVAFRRNTVNGWTRYKRMTASRAYYCLICRQHGAIQEGDRTFVRASDNSGRVCRSCEAGAGFVSERTP